MSQHKSSEPLGNTGMFYLLVKALFNCGPIWFDLFQFHVCVLTPFGLNSGLNTQRMDLGESVLCVSWSRAGVQYISGACGTPNQLHST